MILEEPNREFYPCYQCLQILEEVLVFIGCCSVSWTEPSLKPEMKGPLNLLLNILEEDEEEEHAL